MGKFQMWWVVSLSLMLVGIATAQPVSYQLALERGCKDDITHRDRVDPQWVSVLPNDAPQIAEGTVVRSKISHEDNPANHTSHDFVFHVRLDPEYQNLHSDANPDTSGNPNPGFPNQRLMEMEWETRYFPSLFWPAVGDQVWMVGRWVFDCGHPPYRTEIHPPKAVAFTRFEPTILPGETYPAWTNRTYVYVHGQGGYYQSPVTGPGYEFDIPLPAKPFSNTRERYNELKLEILDLPFGGPKPVLTPRPADDPTMVHVSFPLNPNPEDLSFQSGAVLAVGWQERVLNVNSNPLATLRPLTGYRVLRVWFDSLTILEDHDPDGSGAWNFWVRAGSSSFQVSGLSHVDAGENVPIWKEAILIVPDGGSWSVETYGWEDDCDGHFRPTPEQAEANDAGYDDLACLDDEIVELLPGIEGNSNDRIGVFKQTYFGNESQNFGIGPHDVYSSRNGSVDTEADFFLKGYVNRIV